METRPPQPQFVVPPLLPNNSGLLGDRDVGIIVVQAVTHHIHGLSLTFLGNETSAEAAFRGRDDLLVQLSTEATTPDGWTGLYWHGYVEKLVGQLHAGAADSLHQEGRQLIDQMEKVYGLKAPIEGAETEAAA